MSRSQPPSTRRITASCTFKAIKRLLNKPKSLRSPDTQVGKKVKASVCGTAKSMMSLPELECTRSMARVLCTACKISIAWL